jgi:hypothetical protein
VLPARVGEGVGKVSARKDAGRPISRVVVGVDVGVDVETYGIFTSCSSFVKNQLPAS